MGTISALATVLKYGSLVKDVEPVLKMARTIAVDGREIEAGQSVTVYLTLSNGKKYQAVLSEVKTA